MTNYLYGEFLATTTLHDKAIPYLEKSIKGGIKQARFALALVYVADKKSWPKAVLLLEEYLRDFPQDQLAVITLEALKNKKVEIHYDD